jgi:hypothetical protein
MKSRRHLVPAVVAALGLCVWTWSWLSAQFELGDGFTAGEAVESLTVRIDIAAGGGDLTEPVALDLGLGFPLWLQPVGRAAGETVPFGAVAQSASVGGVVPAGSSAEFTFDVSADPGLDFLRTAPQLLDGVLVSDISRIGFASAGTANWTLGGYEIRINGRPFASHAGIDQSVQAAQEAAGFRQAELDLTIGPLETEAGELRGLIEAGLETADDQERLADIESALAPLAAERQRLLAQRAGRYPWYEEPDFDSPWRLETPIASARVTLLTYSHPGADTRNFVYFRAGGHKYVLNSPDQQLTGELGPQTYQLDLIAGPLTAADLRGNAVGMLAHGGLDGAAPDRWHPQRILVELDGRVVYDSEESAVDRLSLEAIRVIPPAHVAGDGSLAVNTPVLREAFVWHAGAGQGLDLLGGGVAPLPPPENPLYPDPEAGLAGGGLAGPGFDDGFPLFPGEYWPGFDPGWGPGGGWGPGWAPPGPWWPGFAPPPPWGGVFWWFPGLWGDIVHHLLEDLFDDLDPFGDPFQVDNVQIAAGWRYGDTFTITWDVTGDAAGVTDFTVQLLPVHPHDDPFLIGPAVAFDVNVPAGARSWDLIVPPDIDQYRFLRPVVTAWPVDPLMVHDTTSGPARPVFPLGTPPGAQPNPATDYLWAGGGMWGTEPVVFTGHPPAVGRSMWYFAGEQGHIDLDFGDPAPGYNIGLRPLPTDDVLVATLEGGTVTGQYRIIANVGFLGGTDAANTATFHIIPYITAGGMTQSYPADVTLAVVPGVPQPMPVLEVVVDTADIGGGPADLAIIIAVEDGTADFDHPPGFFGLRAVPN